MNASARHERKFLLSRKIEGFAEPSMLALLPPLAAIVVLLAMARQQSSGWVWTAWGIAAFAVVAARYLTGRRLRPDAADPVDLQRQWRAINLVLMLGSLTLASSLPLAAGTLSGPALSAFALAGAVVFGGVLLVSRAAPVAAHVHILALGSGLSLMEGIANGWRALPHFALIAVFGATLIAAVRAQDRRFRTACAIELQRRCDDEAIRSLLTEHEAQAADWSWSIDHEGKLGAVSAALAQALHCAPEEVEGQSLLARFEPGPERERLVAMVAAGTAFHDETVFVSVDGERRLWRISGLPRPGGGMAGLGRDASEPQEIVARVRAIAQSDPLTGLANRHRFNQRLNQLVRGGDRPRSVALLLIGLDDFKAINDVHGLLVGDHLLREMGARLRGAAREADLIARLGGDVFAVVIAAPAGDGILIERAHRLLAAARDPFAIAGAAVTISTSVGIARAEEDCDPLELTRRAGLALSAAKAKGRDQLALFDESLDRRARERPVLEQELREAVGRGEMSLRYQPIVALSTGATMGYEALLRWHHPRRGLLLPDQFIPIAEDSGLILALGDWTIRQALADVADWPGNFRIALNLSPSQIRNPQLVAVVDDALAASGIAPERLEFEITEHVLLKDGLAGAAMLRRLRSLGVAIALDDFGTGYSSLSYLRRFPFDRIKIDRTFVRDLEKSDEARAIVSAITRLADALGMSTTAEGVERPAQLDMLRKLGCDEAQGFLIQAPVEAARIAEARSRGLDMPESGEAMEGYREGRRTALARPRPRSA